MFWSNWLCRNILLSVCITQSDSSGLSWKHWTKTRLLTPASWASASASSIKIVLKSVYSERTIPWLRLTSNIIRRMENERGKLSIIVNLPVDFCRVSVVGKFVAEVFVGQLSPQLQVKHMDMSVNYVVTSSHSGCHSFNFKGCWLFSQSHRMTEQILIQVDCPSECDCEAQLHLYAQTPYNNSCMWAAFTFTHYHLSTTAWNLQSDPKGKKHFQMF